MYGSLTTIALIMLWLYFCMYIMMMSAEVNVIFNESFRKWLKRDRTKKKGLSFRKPCDRIAIEFDADHGHQK